MVELLSKYFKYSHLLDIMSYSLSKNIDINNEAPDDYFYIDVYNTKYPSWTILRNNIKPKNEEAWVIALKQLVERVHLEW